MRVEFAKRSKGHEPTPGRYLGHYKSNYGRRSSSPGKKYDNLLLEHHVIIEEDMKEI